MISFSTLHTFREPIFMNSKNREHVRSLESTSRGMRREHKEGSVCHSRRECFIDPRRANHKKHHAQSENKRQSVTRAGTEHDVRAKTR